MSLEKSERGYKAIIKFKRSLDKTSINNVYRSLRLKKFIEKI